MQSSEFVNHSYDYRPNWTPLSPITIINRCICFRYDYYYSHKNYNFLDCDWLKKLLFSTNSLAKLLSDSLLLDSLLLDGLLLCSLLSDSSIQSITFKVVV